MRILRFFAVSLAFGWTYALQAEETFKMPDNSRHITLFMAGDVMTGRGNDQILPHPGNPERRKWIVPGYGNLKNIV